MTRERGSGVTPAPVVGLLKDAIAKESGLAVSKATGIGMSAIWRYSKGIGEPTTATLQKLADYFGVSVQYLRGDVPRWIPCAEQLPDDNSIVLLATKTSQLVRPGYCSRSHWWTIHGWYIPDEQVTHWMPFPDPPTAEGKP